MTEVDRIFHDIQRLPTEDRKRLFERLSDALTSEPAASVIEARQVPLPEPPPLIRPFMAEPDVLDEVCAMAMEDRKRNDLTRFFSNASAYNRRK